MTFEELARRTVDALLELDPVEATALGEHRYDDQLPDWSAAGTTHAHAVLQDALGALDQVDDGELDAGELVDLEILRGRIAAYDLELERLREHTWNPLLANPGTALYLLVARDALPLADRLRALTGRLSAIPESLAVAREQLHRMPRVHVETAIGQFEGTAGLIDDQVRHTFDADESLAVAAAAMIDQAREAVLEHVAWLRDHLGDEGGDPRLGEQAYAAKLWHALDDETSPDAVLADAEADLAVFEGEIARAAAEFLGVAVPPPDDAGDVVARALASVADEAPVTDATVLPLCAEALERTREFVLAQDLVSVPGDPVRIIEMPEIHRGVAVAYCDPPGPLDADSLPTFFAVAPTPRDWTAERVASFYREYNGRMLHDLTIHEAMPGHVLQLAHARTPRTGGIVRRAFWSGPFVEGWAVYAEELLAQRGYSPDGTDRGALAVRLQRLKMALRMTINAILDIRVHTRGMTEQEAMRLMTVRGHQEEGEAAGKWRRALLTSTQLSTYYVGWRGVRGLVHDVRLMEPSLTDRDLHDRVLAHGSPPPRHLRTLLGL